MKPKRRIVVIGAGIGGMSAAARLAAAGCSVTVIERAGTYGGKIGVLEKDGYTWDSGPSLFTQPYLLEELAGACNTQLSHYLEYMPVPEGTQYFWPDGTHFFTPADTGALRSAIESALHIPADATLTYLENAGRLYHSTASIFLNRPLNRISTWAPGRILPALMQMKRAYLFKSLHQYNVAALRHPKLIQLFDRMATYNGSDPYRCPAMLSAIAHLEFNEGVFYPRGGMSAIARAVYRMSVDAGADYRFSSDVQRIIHANNAVSGVETAEGILEADAVVSNSDVYYTWRDLVADSAAAERVKRQERSSSGLVFYWGMKKRFDNMHLHNIFFSQDYPAEFAALRTGSVAEDFTIYLNITSRMEKGFAPEGCEAWFILVNVPPLHEGSHGYDEALIDRIRARIIRRISAALTEDISTAIATEAVLTPAGIEAATGSYRGALYGSASNTRTAAFLRHPVQDRRYAGLFFCGGTVHPGGGIPLCLRSGKMAADEIIRQML